MVGHGTKFDRKKEEAIAALLTQRSIEEAARVSGIGTQTMYRWLKIPEFQATYLEARRAAFSQTNARLQQASSAAVSTLLKIMVDVKAPASAWLEDTITAIWMITSITLDLLSLG